MRFGKPFRLGRTLPVLLGLAIASQAADHRCGAEESGNTLRSPKRNVVRWCAKNRDSRHLEHLRILSFNDFHGHLSAGQKVSNRPVGGAAVLASWLEEAERTAPGGEYLVVHAGDHVGASPPVSALLQDEPSLSFLNLLAGRRCHERRYLEADCRMVGTLGNHEFDQGRSELLRKLRGGNSAQGPFLENPWKGVRFPYVNANVVDSISDRSLLPPYVVKWIRGIPVALVGIVLHETPSIVTPSGVAGLKFQDEAETINKTVRLLRRQGVKAVVVLIHQGASQTSYSGTTRPEDSTNVSGDIVEIVKSLDPGVDAIVSGHTHAFTNALLPDRSGTPILVTQAWSYGTAFGQIDLELDRRTRDVVGKSAFIQTTWADEGPGLSPDPMVAELVNKAEVAVAPLTDRVEGIAGEAFAKTQNDAGESTMGDLIADAQRWATGTDFAFMNAGGIRASLDSGDITWGELFTIQPFGNTMVAMRLTGAQIYGVLEQQWLGQPYARIMSVSGLSYTWDDGLPVGSRVVEVRKDGNALSKTDTFTVTCNNFMAGGGDNFIGFRDGLGPTVGPNDVDVLVDYVKSQVQPITPSATDRILRLN